MSGLRERKKAKTHAAIQEHAMRLFAEQGYEATTVEQIAAAAEVSPSTLFRYFPTKQDIVLHDALDPLLFAAFGEQPPELSPIQALRASMAAVFSGLTPEDLALEYERQELILWSPTCAPACSTTWRSRSARSPKSWRRGWGAPPTSCPCARSPAR